MKKTIAFVLVMTIILGLAACEAAKEAKECKSLYAHGLDVISMLYEMTHSENFIGIYTANSEIKDIISELGKHSYDTPDAVFAITIPNETLNGMEELSNLGDASEELKRYLTQRVIASLVSHINAMGGVENLAASSVCTVGKTFVSENATEHVIYLYCYNGAAPVAVTFTLGEDHTVSATGTFLLYNEFIEASEKEILQMFNDMELKVTSIIPEK